MPKLPDAPSPSPLDHEIGCSGSGCTRRFVVRNWNRDAFTTTEEQVAYLNQVADAHGWYYGAEFVNGQWSAVYRCPACAEHDQKTLTQPLQAFMPDRQCPACGWPQASVKHCTGRDSRCILRAPRNHLHRTCGRCGCERIEARADDPNTEEACTASSAPTS